MYRLFNLIKSSNFTKSRIKHSRELLKMGEQHLFMAAWQLIPQFKLRICTFISVKCLLESS